MRSYAILLALTAVLAGCAAPSQPPAATTTPSPTPSAHAIPNLVHSVQEGDGYGGNFFDPVTLTIRVGETVTWDIVGEGHHTVDFLQPIDAQGETPKSGDLGPGQTFQATFPETGSYKYYCKYHSNKETGMIGTIVVTA